LASSTYNSTQEVASVARQPDVPRDLAQRDQIEQELATPLRALGLDVEAVELTPAGKRRVLRIAVDGDDGVTLDDVATATKLVSEVLDASDVMGEQPYTLEVTSRGVDRPLTEPRHWRRNAGRLVRLRLADDSSIDGRIGDSDDEGVVIEGRTTSQRLTYDQITTALVQTELNRKDA